MSNVEVEKLFFIINQLLRLDIPCSIFDIQD